MQYKAALTVGQLASNAVKLLPKGGGGLGAAKAALQIGHGAKLMNRVRGEVALARGRDDALSYLDKSTPAGEAGAPLMSSSSEGPLMSRTMGSLSSEGNRQSTQAATAAGNPRPSSSDQSSKKKKKQV
jgi:hypothetical protein